MNGEKVQQSDIDEFPILERATTSVAPVSHQHHVMKNGGRMPFSPAPQGFFGDEAFLPPGEVTELEIMSLNSQRTIGSQNSLASLGGIQMKTKNQRSISPATLAVPVTTNGKLPPLQNHQVLVKKLSQNQSKPVKRKKEKQTKTTDEQEALPRSLTSTPISVGRSLSDKQTAVGLASAE